MLRVNDREWKDFALSELFTILPGKRLETRNKVKGITPFIGASSANNGITGFIGNDNSSRDFNVLGVTYNGAPCMAFYHPYECLFTDDVKRFHLKDHCDNEFVLLFFVALFSKQKKIFSYGYKFKKERMVRQRIMLPIDSNGRPDWKFMEDYVREREAVQVERCRDFLMRHLVEIERERERE